jgi:iron-sulfur cluster assembly accessory protein
MNPEISIAVTEAARAHIATILSRYAPGAYFRLSVKKAGCSGYMYLPEVVDTLAADDIEVLLSPDFSVLIDSHWKAVLADITIDLSVGSLGQTKLVYENPNVVDDCGCGESFNLDDE